jgi:hypothetical protein
MNNNNRSTPQAELSNWIGKEITTFGDFHFCSKEGNNTDNWKMLSLQLASGFDVGAVPNAVVELNCVG